jgi:tetratricopeptide (TPR) repeat protein
VALQNVVGSAYIIVHALTDKINDDLKKGFKGSDREVERTGQRTGEAFTRGFSRSVRGANNVFSKFSRGIRLAIPDAEKSRLEYTKLIRISYAIGPPIAILVGGIGSLVGGLGALVGSAGAAASTAVVLGNVFAALRIGMAAAKLALNGVSEALGKLNQQASGGGAIDNSRQIEDAERNLARVIESTRERLANANKTVERAQLALNEALKAGREEIQQIGFQAEEAGLAEARASLEVERAREQLAKAQDLPPNSRIRREAELALQEAELKLRQARDLSNDLNAEQDRLAVEGVAGTNAVANATEQLAQAEVLRARVVRDGARAQEDAERALKDALEGNNRAVGGGLNPFEGLNEYQIEFVKFLFGLKPLYEELKFAASEAFLPDLEEAITMVVERAFPTVLSGISLVASAMGSASISVARAISDSENLRDTAIVFESSAAVIRSLGRTVGNIWGIALSLLSGASQEAVDFVNFLDRKTSTFASFLNVKQATGELDAFFTRAGDIAADWGKIFGNTAAGIGQLITANFGPGSGGDYLVQWLIEATDKFRNLDDTAGGEDKLSQYFEDVAVNTQKILSSIGALITELIGLGDNQGIGETFDILAEGAPDVGLIAEKLIEAGPAMGEFVENFVKFSEILTDTESTVVFLQTLAVALEVVGAILENELVLGIVIAVSQVGALALAIGSIQKVAQFSFKAAAGSVGFFSKQIGASTAAIQSAGLIVAGKGAKATAARGRFAGMVKGGGKAVGLTAVFAGVASAIGTSSRGAQIAQGAYDEFYASASGVKSLDFNRVWEQQGITLGYLTGGTQEASVSLEKMTSSLYGANKFAAGFFGVFSGIVPEFGAVAESYGKAEDTLLSFGEALGDVATVNLGQAQASFADLAAQTDGSQESLIKLFDMMPGLKEELTQLAIANGLATDDVSLLHLAQGRGEGSSKILERQFDETAAAALDTTGKIQALADAVRGYTDESIASEREAIRYIETVDALTDSLEINEGTLDINTEAGRNNRTAILDLAEASNDLTVATYEAGGSVEDLIADNQAQRDDMLATLLQFGINETEAKEYIETLFLTETDIRAMVAADNVPETKDDIAGVQSDANAYEVGTYNPIVSGQQGDGFNAFETFLNFFTRGLYGMLFSADGNLIKYANGGMSIVSRGVPGQMYQFAEPETRWEALVTGKKSDRARNIKVWEEAGKRLGVGVIPNIAGGFYSSMSQLLPGATSTPAMMGREVRQNNRNINLTVNPSRGMDETELARSISREIEFQLRRAEWEESYQQ